MSADLTLLVASSTCDIDRTALRGGLALNGLSLPNTERLSYTVGDSVHWHVINASNGVHEMHLHGFTSGRMQGASTSTAARSRGRASTNHAVTGVVRPGEWLTITWSPDRPGNWLYPMRFPTGPGHTQDYSFTPDAAGNSALDVQRNGNIIGVAGTIGPLTTVPIRVRAP